MSKVLDDLDIDTKFRNGFWRYSLERLFALTQHHIDFPNDSLLHIESYVLPLTNFPFHSFETLEKLAWLRVDSRRDVAAIVYSPKVATSSWLSEKMRSVISLSVETDDMRVLGEISSKEPQHVEILPSLPHQTSNLRNQSLNVSQEDLIAASSHFSKFDGVFDPAGIGIWLTGTEPRNSFGFTTKFKSKLNTPGNDFIDPENVQYSFDDAGRLSFQSGRESIEIYSLHIHSKNLKYFSEKFEKHLYMDVERSSSGRSKIEFSGRILLNLVCENLNKGTFLQFLSWLPGVRRLKKWYFRSKFD